MSYKIINDPVPISQGFEFMSVYEVEEYLTWFNNIKQERLSILMNSASLDTDSILSDTNLVALQFFLASNIYTRSKTEFELKSESDALPRDLQHIHKIPKQAFIEPTISICFDIAIYFGELLISEDSEITWDIEFNKTMINYGRPILVKPGSKAKPCPSALMQILLMQVHEGTATEDRLKKLYTTWNNAFIGKTTDYRSLIDKLANKSKKR